MNLEKPNKTEYLNKLLIAILVLNMALAFLTFYSVNLILAKWYVVGLLSGALCVLLYVQICKEYLKEINNCFKLSTKKILK